jgi:DNA-binding CsgD family transcriptional regulator
MEEEAWQGLLTSMSAMERAVLVLTLQGFTNQETAAMLALSVRTVQRALAGIGERHLPALMAET